MSISDQEKMRLTPIGVKKLGLRYADYIAQKRLARTLRLNCTEAVALIATQILEFVGDVNKTVAELMDLGKQLLGRRHVLPAVSYLLDSVQVEKPFPDGTKLVTIHDAVASENGNLELAFWGSFLPGLLNCSDHRDNYFTTGRNKNIPQGSNHCFPGK